MKKILLSFAVLGLFAASSCEKLKEDIFPSFETSMGELEVSVPAVSNTTTEASFGASVVRFNVDSVIKKFTMNAFGLNNAKSINAKTVTIDVVNEDDGNDLSNFESINVSISSSNKPTPAVIASAPVSNEAVAPLVINANDVELKEYLSGNNITYTLSGKARKATTKTLDLTVRVNVKVN